MMGVVGEGLKHASVGEGLKIESVVGEGLKKKGATRKKGKKKKRGRVSDQDGFAVSERRAAVLRGPNSHFQKLVVRRHVRPDPRVLVQPCPRVSTETGIVGYQPSPCQGIR